MSLAIARIASSADADVPLRVHDDVAAVRRDASASRPAPRPSARPACSGADRARRPCRCRAAARGSPADRCARASGSARKSGMRARAARRARARTRWVRRECRPVSASLTSVSDSSVCTIRRCDDRSCPRPARSARRCSTANRATVIAASAAIRPSVGNSGDRNDAAASTSARRRRPTPPRGRRRRRRAPQSEAEPADEQRRDDAERRARPASRASTPYSGRRMKSCCSRLSATVACTSTPANSVSSGVATTSRVPSAVVPTNTILSLKASAGACAAQHVGGRDVRERPLGASIAHAADCSCRRAARSRLSSISDAVLTLSDAQADVARVRRRDDGREREAG